MNCFPNITTQIIISLENMERSTATIKFLWDFIYFSGDKAEILNLGPHVHAPDDARPALAIHEEQLVFWL